MAMGGGIFLWEQNETAIPSRSAVDPLSWRPKQRGLVDLTANVAILALLAAQAAIVTRGPLVVNRPTQPRVQVEQSQNIAVYGQAAATAQVFAPLDPAQYRRPPTQVDHFPNLAATAIAVQAFQPSAAPEPTQYRRAAPQLDYSKNLAVNLQTQVAPQYADAQQARRAAQQPDLAPNVAVNLQTQTAGTYVDPVSWRARFAQPAQDPNIAAAAAPVQVLVVTQLADHVAYRAKAAAPDVMPNIAVRFVEPPGLQRPLVEPATGLRRFAYVESYPNLAAFSTVAPYQPAPLVEPTLTRRQAPQPDYYRNIAVSFQGQLVWPSQDVQSQRRAAQAPDLHPNLAALARAPYAPPGMVEPQSARRAPAAPDVFPNVAARATPAAQVFLALPIEPTYSRRYWPQVDSYKNVSVNFTADVSVDVRVRIGVAPQNLLGLDRLALVGLAPPPVLGLDRAVLVGVDAQRPRLGVYS